jgi:hypothetical protein
MQATANLPEAKNGAYPPTVARTRPQYLRTIRLVRSAAAIHSAGGRARRELY